MFVVGLFQDTRKPVGILKELDEASGGWISKVLGSGDFRGSFADVWVQHTLGTLPSTRIMFLGLGEKDKWSLDRWRGAVSRASRACREFRIRRFGLSLEIDHPEADSDADLAVAATEGALLGLYRFAPYKTDSSEQDPDPEEMILLPRTARARTRVERAIHEARIVVEAVHWVRDLVAQPSNRMKPSTLAGRAVEMAQSCGIRHRVLDEREIESLSMGGLLGVASGSRQPPRLIVLEHATKARRAPKVALVGKGITFDSGGISLKPAEKMELMKCDMAGGATVMGAMQAAARLQLPVNLVGVVPATENLPSGSAYKPGDVLTTLSGQTIEVSNTDAEGRVILADALAYARQFQPDLMVDLATLTGACVVALGDQIAGMMGNNPQALDALKRAGDLTGETVWPLPLKEEYREYITSDIADVKNAGRREAGAIQGGLFLQNFVKDTPWVHIDVAGPVWTDKDRPYRPKGATGFGVRLLVAFLKEFRSAGS
jgi:leucyl aminopeptidase